MNKYEEMAKMIRGSSSVDQLLSSMDLPNCAEVMVIPLSPKFKAPQIEIYDGSKDPSKHLETFKTHMMLHGFPWEIEGMAFPLTLKCSTEAWFRALRSSTIHSFEKLGYQFLTQFMANKKEKDD